MNKHKESLSVKKEEQLSVHSGRRNGADRTEQASLLLYTSLLFIWQLTQ